MIKFIKRLFGIEKQAGAFYFRAGGKRRSVDAMKAWSALDKHPRFLWRHLTEASAEDSFKEIRDKAIDITVQAFREVFLLPEFADGRGVTDDEVLSIVMQYGFYYDEVKKKINHFATLPQPMESTSSNSTQSNGSVCGSTSAAQN